MHVSISNHVGARIPKKRMFEVAKYVLRNLKSKSAVDIHIVSADEIKKLNTQHRNKPTVTDVLSFPYEEKDYLGELIICYEIAKQDAHELGIPIREELDVLLVHGLVHLHGYDHVTDKEAVEMEHLEKKLHVGMKQMLKKFS